MKTFRTIIIILSGLLCVALLHAGEGSVYTLRPSDPEAYYFSPENYKIKADGKTDVTEALQEAINSLKTAKAFGILFIPEGKYLISKTIHVPAAIRLIGYGKKRPEIILGPNTPGFDTEQNYMIWFTGGIAQPGRSPQDAGAGTFYSALSNIDLRIEKGNPQAIAIRSHFAQHGFINHCNLYIGEGKAGIYDVGNELEDVRFYGGDYGISSGRTSPGWPMMMVDVRFEGQRKAAVISRETGFAIVNMRVRNVPVGFEMQEGYADRLHLENSWFENVSQAAIVVSVEESSFSQLNILNLYCKNVPTLVDFRQSGRKDEVREPAYHVQDYTYGLLMDDLAAPSHFATVRNIVPLARFSPPTTADLPQLPSMDTWVNIRDLGAKGDGETDDTQAFRDAIAKHKHIYVPQGWYRLTETLNMAGAKLIGLHPFGTQFILKESEPAFSGFGGPVPVIESSAGGEDILNGIGIFTGAFNYRAVGCKWLAGEKSYLNDVKFVGGHGTMRKPNPDQPPRPRQPGNASRISSADAPVAAQGLDLAWDNQYWSLWIGRNGGGTIKDVWTASSYAASGLYVSHTSTPGRIYAMSLEHHVRNEARFESVSNWKIYAFQFEEEGREGKDCKMLELSNCSKLMFANLWMYRVIRASTPQEFGIRLWNCEAIEFRNLHNYTQVLPVIEFPVYEANKRLPVYDWDFARLNVTGREESLRKISDKVGDVNKLAEGFELAAGITADSKGNIYFGENRLKRLYKWNAETQSLSILADYPWKPFTLSTDTEDNLIVIFRYDPQPGYLINGQQETVPRLPDDNPMYSGWGNSGWAARAYSINPNDPDESFRPLPRAATAALIPAASKIIYPASRWRGNFARTVVAMPDTSFVAPDGKTIIPETYDLGRSAALTSVMAGQQEPVFIVHENKKSTVRLEVKPDGSLTNLADAYPHGQYSNVTDRRGNLYIADGEIFVYNKEGKAVNRLRLEERPLSLAIGGREHNILFVTTSRSLYSVRIF